MPKERRFIMEQRKYQNSIELIDLYKVVTYIMIKIKVKDGPIIIKT